MTNPHAKAAEDEADKSEENKARRSTGGKKRSGGKSKEDRIERENRNERLRKGKRAKVMMPNSMKHDFQRPAQAVNRDVEIGETITVAELANKMAVKGVAVIKVMMKMGAMATINQVIDQETAQLVAEEMGHKVTLRRENELEEHVLSDRDTDAERQTAHR